MIVRVHHYLTPRRVFLLATALLLLLIVGRVITQTVWASSSESRSGQHVLRIYDDGVEQGILTDADTLREALGKAGIELAANDITEPALDSQLVAAAYDVNIYRARPVMVVDGETATKVMTPYRTAKQIAKQANIELRSEDIVQVEHGGDVVMAGALERMVIDRAHEVTLVFYGETTTLYTHAKTVGDLLAERDIVPGGDDTLSVAAKSPVVTGMTIELWRNGMQTATVDEDVAFTTREIRDADKPAGYKEIQTKGVNGQRKVTYEVEMRNGIEVKRREINSVTTKEPSEQVEVIGIKSTGGLTKAKGVMMFTDSKGVTHRETYYDLNMLVVMRNCGMGGYYTVREDGAKVDRDGYVIIAAHLGNYPRCSVVETSLGLGKVYDTGGFAAVHPHGFDLATDWTKADGI